MKKLPLIFSLLMFSCAAPKQLVTSSIDISKYQQPYHIFTIGVWNPDFVVLTLTDAREAYFSVKAAKSSTLKKGDIYTP